MKITLCFALGMSMLLGFSTPSSAQFYSSYTYNNNAYLNYALASQKARATRRRGRMSKRSHHRTKKHAKRYAKRHR